MSKSVLIGALAACVLAVGLIAVVTTTVIVDGDGGSRILRADGPFPGPGPGMQMPGPGGGPPGRFPGRPPKAPDLQKLKACLEQHGMGPGSGPDRRMDRPAFRSCMGVPSLR